MMEPKRGTAWAGFDRPWYAATYAAELAAAGITKLDAIEAFYREIGQRLGHSPNPFFAERWYLSAHPDVAAAVRSGEFASAFDHYERYGYSSHDPHWLFSEAFYRASNTDLTADHLAAAGFLNGYDHYLRAGDAEQRSGHWLFDPVMYQKADLERGTYSFEEGAFTRFVRSGGRAGSTHRLSWYFDPEWYLRRYPAVAASVSNGSVDSALEHYLTNAEPQTYDPNEYFSEEFYGAFHFDVSPALADGRFRNYYGHFLRYGAEERRKPHPLVDLQAYFRSVAVQRDIARGLHRDAFAHYCSTDGVAAGSAGDLPLNEAEAKALYARNCDNLIPVLARNPLDFTSVAPRLSVIILASNRFAFTLSALASLRANFGGDMQVILVDCGSRDDVTRIADYARGLDILRLRGSTGFVDGCNAALPLVRAERTLYLNNDVLLNFGAVENAMARLDLDPQTGAVGGKVIRLHGRLQEAGSIIWRDGMASGYLRDGDPNMPEANFVRSVDFCSAVFLLCRTDLLRRLGGFDQEYSPAYFEEADLCLRMRGEGFQTVYDPSISLLHYEFGTTDRAISERLIARNLPIFRRKNAKMLRRQSLNNPALQAVARSNRTEQRRILFIEDRLPFRDIGAGFPRSNDIIRAMAALGHFVTLYPIYKATESIGTIYRDFPDTVEVIHDREMPDLAAFLEARSRYYDAVWIARTHNAERLRDVFAACAQHLPIDNIALDTEAVAAARTVARAQIAGEAPPAELRTLAEQELASGFLCQRIIAVNALDAAIIRSVGFADVEVLGHSQTPRPTSRPWSERHGALFLGAVHDDLSPNLDGLQWFVREVLPRLEEQLGGDASFAIAGNLGKQVDLSPLARHRGVELLGAVPNLAAVYDRYRVFVVPTRFAGGIPYKIHEAAAHGLPIVASELLVEQVGWRDGVELLSAPVDDPAAFAAAVARLHQDENLWMRLRSQALGRIEAEHSPEAYRQHLDSILGRLFT